MAETLTEEERVQLLEECDPKPAWRVAIRIIAELTAEVARLKQGISAANALLELWLVARQRCNPFPPGMTELANDTRVHLSAWEKIREANRG